MAGLTVPKHKKEIVVFDDAIPGFGVRKRHHKNSAAYLFQYKIGAKQRRMSLGKCSAIDCDTARKHAEKLYARVKLGEDPAGAKAESRGRAAETFGHCVETYLAWQRPQVRLKTFADIERHLTRNLAALHGLHISNVDKRAIAGQLSRLAASAPVQANRTRASLSRFFNWAAGEGLVETNVAQLTNKTEERKPRDRHLSEAEIRALWQTLPQGDFGDILKILLLSGQREREISELRWEEIDFERSIIELPPHRTKNHRRHIVPVSAPVRTILKAHPHEDRALVFGNGAGGFSGWSKAKRRLDAVLKIPEWRIHDLRRTAATGMAGLGVQPHIIEAVLNHVSGHKSGVAGIYNRATYESEKATALAIWADHVVSIIEGRKSKVTALRKSS